MRECGNRMQRKGDAHDAESFALHWISPHHSASDNDGPIRGERTET
jgi:hypothetical protein